MAASQESKGEWFYYNGIFLLPPLEGVDKNLFLFSGEDNSVILWSVPEDGGNGSCQPGETYDFRDVRPLKINGQYYKFKVMCLNGNKLLAPSTEYGKKFLTDAVMNRNSIRVSLGDGLTYNYPPSNIGGLLARKKEISQAK